MTKVIAVVICVLITVSAKAEKSCNSVFTHHPRLEVDLDTEEVDFNIREYAGQVSHAFNNADSFLYLSIEKEVPEIIRTNPHTLQRILTIMLSNAIKYTSSKRGFLFRMSYDLFTDMLEFNVTTTSLPPEITDYSNLNDLAYSLGGYSTINFKGYFKESSLYIPNK